MASRSEPLNDKTTSRKMNDSVVFSPRKRLLSYKSKTAEWICNRIDSMKGQRGAESGRLEERFDGAAAFLGATCRLLGAFERPLQRRSHRLGGAGGGGGAGRGVGRGRRRLQPQLLLQVHGHVVIAVLLEKLSRHLLAAARTGLRVRRIFVARPVAVGETVAPPHVASHATADLRRQQGHRFGIRIASVQIREQIQQVSDVRRSGGLRRRRFLFGQQTAEEEARSLRDIRCGRFFLPIRLFIVAATRNRFPIALVPILRRAANEGNAYSDRRRLCRPRFPFCQLPAGKEACPLRSVRYRRFPIGQNMFFIGNAWITIHVGPWFIGTDLCWLHNSLQLSVFIGHLWIGEGLQKIRRTFFGIRNRLERVSLICSAIFFILCKIQRCEIHYSNPSVRP